MAEDDIEDTIHHSVPYCKVRSREWQRQDIDVNATKKSEQAVSVNYTDVVNQRNMSLLRILFLEILEHQILMLIRTQFQDFCNTSRILSTIFTS